MDGLVPISELDRKERRRYFEACLRYYRELKVEPDRPGWREVDEVNNHIRERQWGATYSQLKATEESKASARCHKGRYPSCWICQTRAALEAHHLTYERVGREEDGDRVSLCRTHHQKVHDLSRLTEHEDDSFAWILAKMKAKRLDLPHAR